MPSQNAQTRLLVLDGATVWYWPTPQLDHALHCVFCVPPQVGLANVDPAHTEQTRHTPLLP